MTTVDAAVPRGSWGKQDNRRTAHVAKVVQDTPEITTVSLSDMQILELIGMLSTAMREKAKHKDGYHLALRKTGRGARVDVCHANPPCNGGNASITLVRPPAKS